MGDSSKSLVSGEILVKASGAEVIAGTNDGKFATAKALRDALVFPGAPVDHTADSSDYALSPGETIFKTYSAATSVPLYIATVEGLYELNILGDRTVSISNDNTITLAPNALSSISNTIMRNFLRGANTTGTAVITNNALFQLSSSRCEFGNYLIATKTVSKIIKYVTRFISTSEHYYEHGCIIWSDTTTAWTSLGTIAFPFAQTGTIVIKRIL